MARVKVTIGEVRLPERHRHGIVVRNGVTLTIGDQRVLLLGANATRIAWALENSSRACVTEGHPEPRAIIFECEGELL